jgi:hypothetical protein
MGEFMMEVLNVVAIIVSGLMVGCELVYCLTQIVFY